MTEIPTSMRVLIGMCNADLLGGIIPAYFQNIPFLHDKSDENLLIEGSPKCL